MRWSVARRDDDFGFKSDKRKTLKKKTDNVIMQFLVHITVEKNQTNATNVTLPLLGETF